MANYILSVNAGSSSLKCKVYLLQNLDFEAYFTTERVGQSLNWTLVKKDGTKVTGTYEEPTLMSAVTKCVEILKKEVVGDLKNIKAVGHRIVQGAHLFSDACIMDSQAEEKILSLAPLAPLHNPANLTCYSVFKKLLPSTTGEVGVFDTTLYHSLPLTEQYFPIPYEISEKYKIYRYGAHGISHKYLLQKAEKNYIKKPHFRLITMHIGSGASLSAFKDEQCIATSMGLTPLGGVMMGTRSGDLDPSIVTYMMENIKLNFGQVNYMLTKKSGALGVSGISNDFRDIIAEAKKGNKRAILTNELFISRIADYLGSYFIKLGGLDYLVFSGGVFENSAYLREMLVEKCQSALGLSLDKKSNNLLIGGKEGLISTEKSNVTMLVLPTDEEKMIAMETIRVLHLKG